MELIGRINRRKIYYVQIRNNSEWKSSLPKNDWVAFTIANKEDEELVPVVVKVCMNKNVSYTCSAGTLSYWTEQYFDEEFVGRAVDYEIQNKKEFDYDSSLMTTSHDNFSEGFWFATTLAHDPKIEIDKVVCLDFTQRKVKKHLIELIDKINNGWLPSDEEIELAEYGN
ncbi:hypothetical protein L3X39_06540 [Sabulilitoribacter multivorans]|uniref:Uncharacterized protein n=1 Tax=Flaviramulus multivorans TaxID=1304750 RepID=A0ABS9IHQ5_9FLAO|nr:hypothetical protein [Flaviramulus multivorans]MCF7560293.1 hypothetical protein [Flaviramulus multivorans]